MKISGKRPPLETAEAQAPNNILEYHSDALWLLPEGFELISKRVKIPSVLIEDGLVVSIDETEQADMTVFAEVWLKNIRELQGLGEVL